MRELKTGLYARQICYFLHVSGKLLSLIRFANEPYTLYNRQNASRLARFRKTRIRVKHNAELLL